MVFNAYWPQLQSDWLNSLGLLLLGAWASGIFWLLFAWYLKRGGTCPGCGQNLLGGGRDE